MDRKREKELHSRSEENHGVSGKEIDRRIAKDEAKKEQIDANQFIRTNLGDVCGKHWGSSVDLDGEQFDSPLNFSGCTVNGDLTLRGAKIPVHLDLSGTQIRGNLNLSGANIRGNLYMQGILVEGVIFLNGLNAHDIRFNGRYSDIFCLGLDFRRIICPPSIAKRLKGKVDTEVIILKKTELTENQETRGEVYHSEE